MAPIKRIVTFAAEVSLLNTVQGQTNWHNVRQRREPTTFSSSPRTSTYSPSSSGTSTSSSSVTAPSSSPAIPLSSITPTQVSTTPNATYIDETNNGSSSSSSSVPTSSLTSGTTPQTTDDSSSPPIDGSSWPTYSPTVPTNSTSDNYGLSPSPTVLVGVSSSLPTPFLSGTSSSSPNGPGLTAPPTPFGTGNSISPTSSNSSSNGSTAPSSFGTGNTISPTLSTSSSLSGSSSSPTVIQTGMNSTSPTSSTSSSPTILLTQAGISSAPSPSTSSSLGQTSYIPTPSGTSGAPTPFGKGISGSPTSFGTNNMNSGSPTPWGTNKSLGPTPLYHTHSSSPIASSGGNDYTWSYPTLGPTTSGSSTVTEDGTTTSPSASSISSGSSSLVPSTGGSGGLGLSPAPTSSLTDGVSSLASNSPTSSLTDVISSFAPSSSLTTSPTLGTGVGMTSSPTPMVISSPTYSPSAVGAEATTESGVQSNSPTSSSSVLNEITTSPSSSPTIQQVLATSKPTISEISSPPLDESTQVTPDVGSYDEEILEGALDTSIIHKKESEENNPLHFDGHFKSSSENNIFIPPDVSIAQQIYEHEMSDHNVVASEVEAYARIKEEEEEEKRQAQLVASGILRVKSSHITVEGQEYERLRDEFPQSEYALEYEIQGIDQAENISSSVRISTGDIAMIASVLITWMLAL